uniref:SSD domain-containing protein n=1 Tax=Plectus sambesii TaxID=2011161 RepID=A0A914WCH1_9BILA
MRINWNWALLEKPVGNLCKRYARIVAQYPAPFIILPILLTAALATGLTKLTIFRNVDYLFAPLDARWKYEEEVFHNLWARTDDQFYPGKDVLRRKGLHMIVTAADDGSVLRLEQAQQFMDLLAWVENSTFVYNGTEYGYHDICLIFQNQCYVNSHANFLARIFINGDQDEFKVTYPQFRSTFQSDAIDLTMTLGGVETDPKTEVIKTAKAWLISYQLKQQTPLLNALSNTFETTMGQRIWRKETPTSLLNVYFFHSNTFEEELDEGNKRITPRFILTFIVVISFSIFGTITLKRKGSVVVIDWVTSKPYLAWSGVMATLLAIISAVGLGLHLGILFIDMVTVMPFLIISIGIDDMFLILAAWRSTDREAPVIDRIETAMQHAGVSVTMTSATDALSFFIGAMAPLPA